VGVEGLALGKVLLGVFVLGRGLVVGGEYVAAEVRVTNILLLQLYNLLKLLYLHQFLIQQPQQILLLLLLQPYLLKQLLFHLL
jgi:hypothetical protein